MPTDKASLSKRVANQFTALTSAAKDLNAVSDELGTSVSELDSAMTRLSLGIPVWVTIRKDDGLPDESWYWSEDLGYAKVSGKWGFCLRKVRGDHQAPDDIEDETEEWLFKDAPRALRLASIEKIPELLEKLSSEAIKQAKEVREKLRDVQTVTEAVKTASASLSPLDLTSLRKDVVKALKDQGHFSASQLLDTGRWSVKDDLVRVEVPKIGHKMLSLTVNAASHKILACEFRDHGVARYEIVPQVTPMDLDALLPKLQQKEEK